jgi:hypothetical protein
MLSGGFDFFSNEVALKKGIVHDWQKATNYLNLLSI